MNLKFPPYNEYEDINDILSKVGHQQEYNVSRIFAFCHEISHVAFRRKNTLAQEVQKQVITYCELMIELIELSSEVDIFANIERDKTKDAIFLDISHKLLDNSDAKLLEEICCDIMALFVLAQYFEEECDMEQEQIRANLSSIHYLLICISWLSSSEEFWNGLTMLSKNSPNLCRWRDELPLLSEYFDFSYP